MSLLTGIIVAEFVKELIHILNKYKFHAEVDKVNEFLASMNINNFLVKISDLDGDFILEVKPDEIDQ